MDNRQKAVIVVLVAVMLLFVVAVVVQTTSDDGNAATSSEDREGLLQSLSGDPAAVRLDDLRGCQRQGDTLIVETACDLDVLPSDDRMRLLRLHAQDPIGVTAPAPDEANFKIEKELAAGDEVAVAVDRDGAEIELACGFGQTCVVLIGGGQ